MEDTQYVEDVIVPLLAISKNDNGKFRFLGTGFYIDNNGYLVTCKHVVETVTEEEKVISYQLGKKRETEIEIIRNSDQYDISLCKSLESPDIESPWLFFDQTIINLGYDVEVYGFVNEPIGEGELPFRRRYLRGYITGISRENNYPDSFELNFPVLFGMSGSPLVCHLKIKGEEKKQTGIVVCEYGSSEQVIVHHSVVKNVDYEERV